MNFRYGLLFPALLAAVMILGVVLPVLGQPPVTAPKISLEPAATLVRVSTRFVLTVWIRDIPAGYSMGWYSYRVSWDPKQMELVSVLDEDHGWQTGGSTGSDYVERLAGGPGVTGDASWLHLTFHCLAEGPAKVTIASPNGIDIYVSDPQNPVHTNPDPFDALVSQVPNAVGGVVMPTNTLAILSPYLAIAGLVVAVSAVVVVKKRRD